MNLETKTISDIRALNPCYDPVTGLDSDGERYNDGYLLEDWRGTAIDILQVNECPPMDRLWVVSHWLDDRTLRLFAVWCAREALALVENPDPRSIEVCNIAERFAFGHATKAELAAALAAAWAASGAAAWAASGAAVRAAWAAAWVTAWAAAWAAWVAAGAAALAANRAAQINHLIKMLEE